MPIKFNNKVQPICLPSKNHDEGKYGYVAGWGGTKIKNDRRREMLKETELKIVQEFQKDPNYDFCKKNKSSICAQGITQKPF